MVEPMTPPAVRGLTHVSLSVGDLDRSLRFYRDLLGLGVLMDMFRGEVAAGAVHSGVKPLPGFGHFIELRDPDGILVELHAM